VDNSQNLAQLGRITYLCAMKYTIPTHVIEIAKIPEHLFRKAIQGLQNITLHRALEISPICRISPTRPYVVF